MRPRRIRRDSARTAWVTCAEISPSELLVGHLLFCSCKVEILSYDRFGASARELVVAGVDVRVLDSSSIASEVEELDCQPA